ncbi:hypothetical protein IGJ02_002101 [Enterococcus sp. DIV0724b]|uniref:hypothetical protein n=1 Tax=Enterococcus sp. DIV0724b TaxID=2774694 RepID=UPI003D2FCCE7
MKEIQENVEHDLEYYQSGIRQLYMKHYQKYLFIILAILLVTVVGIGLSESLVKWLLIVLFLIEAGLVVYLLRYLKAEAFENYFQRIKAQLPGDFHKMESIEIQEDDQAYYFLDDQALYVKLKKKNTRNFPSKIRQYTLLVGFTDELDEQMLESPLQFFYYDITQIKHSANYKKEMLKNTNFIAKRKKRRIKSAIFTILILALVGTFVYFGAKKYLNDTGRLLFEKQVEQEYQDKIGQETRVRISELSVTNEDETLKIDLPKHFHEEEGSLLSVDNIKGQSSKTFTSDVLYISLFMSEARNASSLSDFVNQVMEEEGKSISQNNGKKLHPDLFKNEYIVTTKISENGQDGANNYTTYFFETDRNYGWIMCEIDYRSEAAELNLDQQVHELLRSIVVDRDETII